MTLIHYRLTIEIDIAIFCVFINPLHTKFDNLFEAPIIFVGLTALSLDIRTKLETFETEALQQLKC